MDEWMHTCHASNGYQIWNMESNGCVHACIHKGGFVQCKFCLFSFGDYIVWKLCLLALPTKTRILLVFRFIIIEYSSLRDFGP
jgi:hypothetical protein